MRASGHFKLVAVAVLILATWAFAQGKPKVAVYVTSGSDKSMAAKMLSAFGGHKIVGNGLAKAISATGKCDAVNLTGDITKGYGATVDETQAAAIGRQFGVQYLCIVVIRDVKGKAFNLAIGVADVANGKRIAVAGSAINLSDGPGTLKAMGTVALELTTGIASNILLGSSGGGTGAGPAPAGQQIQPSSPAQTAIPVHERPFIAVYVRGNMKDEDLKSAFATELLLALAKNGRYRAINANNKFIAEVNGEITGQNGNSPSDSQIAQTGNDAKADFVCVVDVKPVLDGFQIVSRVIGVKNADVVEIGNATGKITTTEEFLNMIGKIVESMTVTNTELIKPVQPIQQVSPIQSIQQVRPAAPIPQTIPEQPVQVQQAKETKPDYSQAATVNKNIESDMVFVQGGTFTMGCTAEQGSDCASGEKPAHKVTVNDFYLYKFEVTQTLWRKVMDSNPSKFTGYANLPVEQVSWEDVYMFIRMLNTKTGRKYRLPTEAEWEYAARGGNKSRGYKYSGSNTVDDVAWNYTNSIQRTHPVGAKQPNELGLYDMSGNVLEWVGDFYGSYTPSNETNTQGLLTGATRVFRGGSWFHGAASSRVSFRGGVPPDHRSYSLGFRLACDP